MHHYRWYIEATTTVYPDLKGIGEGENDSEICFCLPPAPCDCCIVGNMVCVRGTMVTVANSVLGRLQSSYSGVVVAQWLVFRAELLLKRNARDSQVWEEVLIVVAGIVSKFPMKTNIRKVTIKELLKSWHGEVMGWRIVLPLHRDLLSIHVCLKRHTSEF